MREGQPWPQDCTRYEREALAWVSLYACAFGRARSVMERHARIPLSPMARHCTLMFLRERQPSGAFEQSTPTVWNLAGPCTLGNVVSNEGLIGLRGLPYAAMWKVEQYRHTDLNQEAA